MVIVVSNLLPKRIEDLGHAYCFEGEAGKILPGLLEYFKNDLKIEISGNPDYSQIKFELFSIDETRNLIERQSRRGFGGGHKFFVIEVDRIAHEAQNALLKVFEEPTPGTHFFLILPTAETLLPTLRSRLQIVSSGGSKANSTTAEVSDFISASIAKRLLFAKKLAEAAAEDESREQVRVFLNELEQAIRGKGSIEKVSPENRLALSELATVRSYLNDRGPAIKMILEHLALIIPGNK